MIISNSRDYIFVHIPKCGGSSILGHLDRTVLAQDVTLNRNRHGGWEQFIDVYRSRYKLYKHATLADIERAVQPKHISRYFVFTFCRNPFARAYSAYRFTLKSDARYRPDHPRHRETKDMSFEDFLVTPYAQEQKMLQFRPQSHWVRGKTVEAHVFRLEELDTAIPALNARLFSDTPLPLDVPRRNASTEPGEWMGMSERAEAMVCDLYREDFEYFDYPDKIERP